MLSRQTDGRVNGEGGQRRGPDDPEPHRMNALLVDVCHAYVWSHMSGRSLIAKRIEKDARRNNVTTRVRQRARAVKTRAILQGYHNQSFKPY